MSSTLPDLDTLDECATGGARFASALVNAEIILKITPFIDPIDASPLSTDAILQHLPDARPKSFGLYPIEGIGDGQRVQTCHMKSLIGVYVSQSSDESLVEEKGFQLTATGLQAAMQFLLGEISIQGLRTELSQHNLRVRDQPGTPKLTCVVECQANAAFQVEHQTMVRRYWLFPVFNDKIAAHT
jgi:hypothetical protein